MFTNVISDNYKSYDDVSRTESYDQMGPVGVDPRWDVFAAFHTYLLKAFPLT